MHLLGDLLLGREGVARDGALDLNRRERARTMSRARRGEKRDTARLSEQQRSAGILVDEDRLHRDRVRPSLADKPREFGEDEVQTEGVVFFGVRNNDAAGDVFRLAVFRAGDESPPCAAQTRIHAENVLRGRR